MITANELRIGNWVQTKEGEAVQCRNIDADGINLEGWAQPIDAGGGDIFTHEHFYKGLDPIPLTPEILEKAGFENNELSIAKKDLHLLVNQGLIFIATSRYECVSDDCLTV